MTTRKTWMSVAALLAVAGVAPVALHGQTADESRAGAVTPADTLLSGATIRLRIDGMSCPFCAYALEERLRKLPMVDSVLVRVSDGIVLLRTKGDEPITDGNLRDTVKRAGFSLREIYRIERP